MAKRQSLSNNTLYNYFSPLKPSDSPSSKSKSDLSDVAGPSNIQTTPKASTSADTSGKLESIKKRRMTAVDSSDDSSSDTEVHPSIKKRKIKVLYSSDDSNSDSENKDVVNTPKKVDLSMFKKGPSSSAKKSKLENSSTPDVAPKPEDNSEVAHYSGGIPKKSGKEKTELPSSQDMHSHWPHLSYPFMQDNNIMDSAKRLPQDPEYNPRTRYVPLSFLANLTPGMRQWWDMKSQNIDTILFFKVGKFYELYHMDAVIGVQELGFVYMKGDFAHTGFPETAYGKMSTTLIELGYKIARIEQTETPEMMERRYRQRGGGKFARVVNREICQISTKATTVYGPMQDVPKYSQSLYLCALTEKPAISEDKYGDFYRFGLCFVDTTIGVFHLAEFNDDRQCSRLLALFATFPPGLFLIERGHVTDHILNKVLPLVGNAMYEMLHSKTQFSNHSETLVALKEGKYFMDKEGDFHWPTALQRCIEPDDALEESAKLECQMAVSALGACLYHLSYSQLAIQLLSLGKMEWYQPLDMGVQKETSKAHEYMVIDSITVNNLKLTGAKGSLQKNLDYCITPFAKRALPTWICRPLCNVEAIQERQEAVQELLCHQDKLSQAREILKLLPDFERAILRLHMFGNKLYATEHPDSRAIFYEAKTYSKRKIMDFVNTLNGFEAAQGLQALFQHFESPLMKRITQPSDNGGEYVDIGPIIRKFKQQFNFLLAQEDGKIIPTVGQYDDFDNIEREIAALYDRSNEYLETQSEFFGTKISYLGNEKKRFQLEVPENKYKLVTSEYHLEGSKRGTKTAMGTKRYSTQFLRELRTELISLESKRHKIVADMNRRIFEEFATYYDTWKTNVEFVKTLDMLCCFAEFARNYENDICTPEILPMNDENPTLHIENGRHPCTEGIEDFVPNDTILGEENFDRLLLLTGPNMGGKSTLMRQVALLTIIAQMGCLVPAVKMRLSLVQRIFTRIGARDDILSGGSTFMVEMMEAASILRYSTNSSLLLIDELGRGTSTHDGMAIATAYVKHLHSTKCRTIFSTHYHNLVDRFYSEAGYQFGHMACMVEDEDDQVSEKNITFLYKLVQGRCPKSYGFFAARLAGLPDTIIKHGREFANNLQTIEVGRHLLKNLFENVHNATLTGDHLRKLQNAKDSILQA